MALGRFPTGCTCGKQDTYIKHILTNQHNRQMVGQQKNIQEATKQTQSIIVNVWETRESSSLDTQQKTAAAKLGNLPPMGRAKEVAEHRKVRNHPSLVMFCRCHYLQVSLIHWLVVKHHLTSLYCLDMELGEQAAHAAHAARAHFRPGCILCLRVSTFSCQHIPFPSFSKIWLHLAAQP